MEEQIRADKYFLISDSNVYPICGSAAEKMLGEKYAGRFIIEAGEKSKNLETVSAILEKMAECRLDRSSCVIALGGGVTGDISGLCASLYMRGCSLVMIPTSLIAMTDSSVGGKNGVDFAGRKNLIGTFRIPDLVLCDCSLLSTLPREYFIDGCGEIVKYAMLESVFCENSISELVSHGIEDNIDEIVALCVALKVKVTELDPYDHAERKFLNFGHTAGHAIEAAGSYTLSHGRAVAIGMAIFTRAAYRRGYCSFDTVSRLEELLERNSLPGETEYDAETLTRYILSDKKVSADHIDIIIPRTSEDGRDRLTIMPLALDELCGFIGDGL